MTKTRKVLITGGNGFVGRNLVDRCKQLGHRVIVTDIHCETIHDDVTYINVDITDAKAMIDACENVDTIIHNASVVQTKKGNEAFIRKVNYHGTLNVIEACRVHRIPRMVYISSASVVYEGEDIENGDENLRYSTVEQAAYAASKIDAEKAALAFNNEGITRVCALRPHVIFGPEDNRFIPNILEKAAKGALKRAIGDRDKYSDFTYVSNFIDAIVMAEEQLVEGSPVCGQAYFITNGEPKAFFDFVEECMVAFGYPKIKGKVPFWLAYTVAAVVELWALITRAGAETETGISRFAIRYMVTHHYYSIAKAKRDFGWQPRISLAEGIALTADYLRKNNHPLIRH